MKKIVVASNNQHKIQEMQAILNDEYQLLSMKDIGFNEDIEENGTTFHENALIKARAIAKICDYPVISDDSGICIQAFDGGPGIHSARFLGHNTSYDYKNAYIIEHMKDATDRSAYFMCVIAYIDEQKNEHVFEGRIDGSIAFETKGQNGFGYDPIFYLQAYQTTMSHMDEAQKNQISHRSQALQAFRKYMYENSN